MTEEKKDPIIFDEQGILLSNIIDLTNGRSQKGIDNTNYNVFPDQAASSYKNFLSPNTESGLPNVCLIDTKTPSTFLNLLKADPANNDLLLRLSTFELSNLIPLIRVFKVFYDSEIDQELILEFPFDTKANDIDSIFESSNGRGGGVGITSVEWKQNPKNEANLSTYKVNLNLHLQNVEEFFKNKYSTSISGKTFSIAIQDLLYQRKELRKETNEGSAVYDPDKYVIKMVVGWEISESGLESIRDNSNRSKEETDLLIKVLKEQKEVFYLTFISHTIEFNEDGSIDLQINYFGRADTNIADIEKSNIFNLGTGPEALIQNLKKEIETLQKQNSEISEQVDKEKKDKSWYNLFSTDNENKLKTETENLEKLKQNLKDLQLSAKKAKFNRITTRLLNKKYIHIFAYKKELVEQLSKLKGKYNLTSVVNNKDIIDFKIEKEKIEKRIQADQEKLKNYVKTVGEGVSLVNSDISVEVKEILKSSQPDLDTLQNKEQVSEFFKAQNELYELFLEGKFDKPGNDRYGLSKFSFFYLSSLIDVLLEPILNNNLQTPNFINKKTRVILGPMSIVDYGSLESDGRTYKIFDSLEAEKDNEPTYVKVFTGKRIDINIGDIPISFRDFTNWLNEYYINKDKEQATFNEFITALMNDLVITSINNQVYPYAPKQKAKFSLDCFTSVIGPKNESAFINNIQKYRFGNRNYATMVPSAGGFRIDQAALESFKTKSKDLERDHDPDSDDYLPNKDYIVLYCVNNSPYERTGDYFQDKKDGILHLYAGESKGTLTSIKFSRVDNPNRRAENILAATGEGRGVSKVIREKYNVLIEMLGNTTIQAGTYIFLRPTFAGASSKEGNSIANTENILRELGLGGYYMVTQVESSISTGEFKTSIRGTWSAFGDGTINDGEREYGHAPEGLDINITKGQII